MQTQHRSRHPAAEAPAGTVLRSLGQGLARFGRMTYDAWRLARRRRAAFRALHMLDDRILKDIGISRGEIPWLAEIAARSEAPLQRGLPRPPQQPPVWLRTPANQQHLDARKAAACCG